MFRFFTITAVLFLLCCNVCAGDLTDRQAGMLNTDSLISSLPESVKGLMENSTPTNPGNFGEKAWRILKETASSQTGTVRKALKTTAGLVFAATVCAVFSTLVGGQSDRTVSLAGSAAILLLCAGDMKAMIGLGCTAVEEISVFAKLLIPVMGGAAAASGAVTASAALYSGSILLFEVLVSFFSSVLVPAVCAYIALSAAESAVSQGSFRVLADMTDSLLKLSLKASVFLFTAYLSLTGIISGSVDAVSLKAAKITVSSAVPVVGGMISDATESVLVSAMLLRNSIGVFGMLAVLAVAAAPFLQLGIHYLVLQLAGALCAAVGGKCLTGLIRSLSTAMGYLLAIVGCAGMMTFFSCICFMRAGGF